MIEIPIVARLTVDTSTTVFSLSIEQTSETYNMAVDSVFNVVDAPIYTGDYTVVPSDEAITLYTDGKLMEGNVTVEKIPSNYGKIGWNGSYLTVS